MKKIIGLCGLGVLSGCIITADEETIRLNSIPDCSGEIKTWYRDKDGDGFGGYAESTEYKDGALDDKEAVFACLDDVTDADLTRIEEAGFIEDSSDCDDTDSNVHPDAKEDCDTSYDDNCDDDINGYGEAENCTEWYADADGDGYGSEENSTCDCFEPEGYPLEVAGDCNDLNADVNPGMEEVCGDGFDNNCDDSANNCGLSSPHDLGTSGTIYLGEVSKDYAGTEASSGVLLSGSDDVAAVVLSREADFDSSLQNVGRVDVLAIGEGDIMTSDASASIWGTEVSTLGSALIGDQDIDGDGNHDLLVGALYMSSNGTPNVGAVSIFSGPLQGEKTMEEYDYHFYGESSDDRFGASASVWKEGSTQIWVGAPKYDVPLTNGGAVFLFDPSAGNLQSVSDAIVMIDSEASYSRFGTDISEAIDANGDGIRDVGVGARSYNGARGSAYVFWGEITGNRNAFDADVLVRGVNENDEIGTVVEFVDDMTGDGYADLVLGSPISNTVYLLPANTAGEYTTTDAAVVLQGPADSETGYSVANVGDVNGDNLDDFAVGARIASAVYLLYGPLEGTYNLETDAIILQDSGADQVGSAIAPVGDNNGDGLDDFLIGAQISSRNVDKSGSVFLVEGEGL